MAIRLLNLHHQPLRVDLRGGAVLLLAPGARSAALREELLYDNHHVADWERAGWLKRVPARMRDVAQEPPAFAAPAAGGEAVPAADEAAAGDAARAGDAGPEADAGAPAPDDGEGQPATPATGRRAAGGKSGQR